jgi:predicted phosphodiesterase
MNDSRVRIALLADVHGNLIALDAVLDDLQKRGGADEIWVLGDLAALGPAPMEVLERLDGLPNAACVGGNTERYVCTGERPSPSLDQAREDPSLLPVLVEVEGSFAWTLGAVGQGGWLEWLSALPVERRAVLPDGTRMLGVHVGPGHDDGAGFYPGLTEAERAFLLGDCDADLVCVGHTHTPLDVVVLGARRGKPVRVVNPGSVSNPVPPDLRASYALLEADRSGVRVTHYRVAYDREAVIAELQRLRHPGGAFVERCLRGQVQLSVHRPVMPQR